MVPENYFGIDLNKPQTLNNYFERFGTYASYARFIGFQFGLDSFIREGLLSGVLSDWYR